MAHIPDDSHNLAGSLLVFQSHHFTDGVSIRPIFPCQGLTDYSDRLAARRILIGQAASAERWNLHGMEKVGTSRAPDDWRPRRAVFRCVSNNAEGSDAI